MEVVESKEKYNIPIWHKLCLTIEEAAAYSNIGEGRIRSLLDKKNCSFALKKGNRILIKREAFEKWVNSQIEII